MIFKNTRTQQNKREVNDFMYKIITNEISFIGISLMILNSFMPFVIMCSEQ